MNVGSYLLTPFVAVHGTRDLGLSATAAGVFPIRRGQPPGQRGRTGAGRATAPDRLLGREPGRGCVLRRVLRLVHHADAARRAAPPDGREGPAADAPRSAIAGTARPAPGVVRRAQHG